MHFEADNNDFKNPDELIRKCKLMSLSEISGLLRTPVTLQQVTCGNESISSMAGDDVFPIINGNPILYPAQVLPYIKNGILNVTEYDVQDPILLYAHIFSIKLNYPQPNSDPNDIWYWKHVHRTMRLISQMKGTVLDIGCGDVSISSKMFPEGTQYVGLDPFPYADGTFHVIGMSEFLPFANETFDNITMLTNLDHSLDYKSTLKEAFRVLRKNGRLYLATLIWNDNFELWKDHVHFHHFFESELLASLSAINPSPILQNLKYCWKENSHRHGVYMEIQKL